MNGLGTDLVAMACILGGAAVSGATTMALVDGHAGHADVACVGAAVDVSPRVAVSLDGGKSTVITTPRVWVRHDHDCRVVKVDVRRDVRVDMDQVRAQLEQARERLEQARTRVQRAAQDEDQAALGVGFSEQIQKQIDAQVKRLDEELAKLDAGTGR